MQFGRFHGIALLALGALLLLVQTVVIFNDKALPRENAPSSPPPAKQPSHAPLPGVEYLSGVLGIILAGAGVYVLAEASHKGALQRTEEERQKEDRSFGRQDRHVSTPTMWKER